MNLNGFYKTVANELRDPIRAKSYPTTRRRNTMKGTRRLLLTT